MAFRLGLGHIALDLLATLRARETDPVERLARSEDLDMWLVASGALAPSTDSGRPSATHAQLGDARALRETIFRLLDSALHARDAAASDIKVINRWARLAPAPPQLARDLTLAPDNDDPVIVSLSSIARQAIELLTGDELGRVRRCAGCSLLFLDRSRPGRRKWCSMDRCGNRSKTARYRAKQR